MPRFIDRTNQRNGRLTYQKFVGKNKHRQSLWEAKCDCGKVVTVIGGTCESCGCLMHEMASKANQHPKSEATKKKLSEIRKIKDTLHTCPVCNKEFVGTKFQRFCSVSPCQRKYFASGSHRERARERGGKVEAVRFWKMYERDKGICQECRVFCPKELRGDLTQKLSPTMGHTIPLSQGGDHTYANVQLECWGCNNKKSNAMPEGVVEPRINPDPRTRIQKISEETRKAMQRPEVRARFLAAIAKRKPRKRRFPKKIKKFGLAKSYPDLRTRSQKMSDSSKERWADPEERTRIKEAMAKVERPNFRPEQGKTLKTWWAVPENKERMKTAMKAARNKVK